MTVVTVRIARESKEEINELWLPKEAIIETYDVISRLNSDALVDFTWRDGLERKHINGLLWEVDMDYREWLWFNNRKH